jgi:two-component system, NarL family, nitrate/nitrite response regulator NarL
MTSLAMHPIDILIIDDHALLSAGLRLMIESQRHMRVVGEATSRATALRAARDTAPDIILLDLDLGDDSGFDLLPELLNILPDTRVIVLTGLRDPEGQRRAVMLGAMGLVLKEKAIETVLKAIEKVHAGEVWLDRSMIASILRAQAVGAQENSTAAARIGTLTDRERDVIRLVGEGLKNKQIAERLVISEATVRHHLTSIFSKVGVTDRFELVIYAYRYGLARLR